MRIISHQIENTNNEIEIIKKNQIEVLGLKITITKMNNSADRFNNRLDITKDRISKIG